MAKSIYDVLATLITETSVPQVKDSKGNVIRSSYGDVEHTIPRELLPTDIQFESESELLDWATDNDCLHSCLQKGIQKMLIEIRATFKGMKKDTEWTESYGQDNVDSMEWKITKRPNQGSTKKLDEKRFEDCMNMIVAMTAKQQDAGMIRMFTEPIYGEEMVNAIFEAIKESE